MLIIIWNRDFPLAPFSQPSLAQAHPLVIIICLVTNFIAFSATNMRILYPNIVGGVAVGTLWQVLHSSVLDLMVDLHRNYLVQSTVCDWSKSIIQVCIRAT